MSYYKGIQRSTKEEQTATVLHTELSEAVRLATLLL